MRFIEAAVIDATILENEVPCRTLMTAIRYIIIPTKKIMTKQIFYKKKTVNIFLY